MTQALDMDGGVSRLRLAGTVAPELHGPISRRWLGLLPPAVAATVDEGEFFA